MCTYIQRPELWLRVFPIVLYIHSFIHSFNWLCVCFGWLYRCVPMNPNRSQKRLSDIFICLSLPFPLRHASIFFFFFFLAKLTGQWAPRICLATARITRVCIHGWCFYLESSNWIWAIKLVREHFIHWAIFLPLAVSFRSHKYLAKPTLTHSKHHYQVWELILKEMKKTLLLNTLFKLNQC